MSESITNSGFFTWLMDMLRDIAGIRTPFFNGAMSGATVLGEEMAFIVIGMIVLWCVDKRFGYRFLFMYVSGYFLNQLLKAIFLIPRPWVIDPSFEIVESARAGATGWSFPSGHTQSAVIMYGGLAGRVRKGWAYALAALIVLLVGFSRMYLGVHTLLDVAAGALLGVLTLIVCFRLFARIGDGAKAYALASAAVAALCLGLIIFILTVTRLSFDASQLKDAAVLFGTAFGLFAGSVVERAYVRFDTKAAWWVQIIKVVLGVAVLLALRVALKKLLGLISDSPLMDSARYFGISFVAIAVYPRLFKPLSKLGTGSERAR